MKNPTFVFLSLAALLLLLQACQPTKILVAKYNPAESKQLPNNAKTGLIYYLPKKYLRLEVQAKVYRVTQISEYKSKFPEYKVLDERGIIQGLTLTEQILADEQEAVFLKFSQPESAVNNLTTAININDLGLLTSINVESEGKASEVFNDLAQTTGSLIKLGTAILDPAATLLASRDKDSEEEVSTKKISIDTLQYTFTRLIEINQPGDTIISLRDFIPSLESNQRRNQIRISIEANQLNKHENPLKSTGSYTEGILYRVGVPLRTVLEIRHEADEIPFLRNQPLKRRIVFDNYISYPQFGGYAIANLKSTGGSKRVTNMTFHPSGSLSTYTIDKETNNVERNRQLQESLKMLENNALDIRSAPERKRKAAREARLEELRAEIEAEKELQRLEEEKMELERKRKEMELRNNTGN